MKKLILFFIISFLLISCSQERNILNPDSTNTFKNINIDSPFYWDPNSKVQLIIFSDFQCPACINFEKNIWEELINNYALTNKVGLTYKSFPLDIHVNAPEDALASMCAHEQGKYKEFAKKMYSLEELKKWLRITIEDRQLLANWISLDIPKYNTCVNEWRYVDKIKQDMNEWEKMWLQWTPSVYANGTIINYGSKEDLFNIIEKLLK